jgi:hypothetical protein
MLGCPVTLSGPIPANAALRRSGRPRSRAQSVRQSRRTCLDVGTNWIWAEYDHVFLMGPLYHLVHEEDGPRPCAWRSSA